ASPGVETDVIELSDGGYAWFELLDVTPERPRTFEEVSAEVKASFLDEERREAISNLVAKQIADHKPGEGLEGIATTLSAKVERTSPLQRGDTAPTGLTPAVLKKAFELPKGEVASVASPDGKSRFVFRVVEVTPAPEAKAEQTASIKDDLAKQM